MLTAVRIYSLEEREEQRDRLEFVRGQLNRLTENIKEGIKALTEEVAAKVRDTGTPISLSLQVGGHIDNGRQSGDMVMVETHFSKWQLKQVKTQ